MKPINQTTINLGPYKLRKVTTNPWEKERWSVGIQTHKDSNIQYLGDIVKIEYRPHKAIKPIKFWMCEKREKFGYRAFLSRMVSNTRKGALIHLLEMRY